MAWGKPDPAGAPSGAAALVARVAAGDAALRRLHVMAQRTLSGADWEALARALEGNDTLEGADAPPPQRAP